MQLKRNKGMEFEILKKSHKKQIIIGALAICVVGGALTFATSRAKYRVDGEIDLAKGTINYKPYDFKIIAMYKSEDGTNYSEINTMPESGYVINEEKTYCTTDNKTQVKGKIKTVNGIHGLYNISKSDKCYLYFDKYIPTIVPEELITTLKVNSGTPDFSKTATTDEGVYSISDSLYGGTSYYWRGAVTNNYVKFAGLCWRIIRINGDKSIRLIYDGTTCHANGTSTEENIAKTNIIYNIVPTRQDMKSYHVGWTYSSSQRPSTSVPQTSGTSSNAKIELENWYNDNLSGFENQIADGKYCNDRNVGQPLSSDTKYVAYWSSDGTQFRYAGVKRLFEYFTPTLSCSNGDIYSLKVGLITADEIELAGGNESNNSSYYLYNGNAYYSMTPYVWISWAWCSVFCVKANGALDNCSLETSSSLRPVINLKSNIKIQESGDGTLNNPYVVQ